MSVTEDQKRRSMTIQQKFVEVTLLADDGTTVHQTELKQAFISVDDFLDSHHARRYSETTGFSHFAQDFDEDGWAVIAVFGDRSWIAFARLNVRPDLPLWQPHNAQVQQLAFVQPLHNAAGQLEGIPLDNLPSDLAAEIILLARKARDLSPIMIRVLKGERYRCTCEGCTAESSFPLGICAPNLCGPCWNGCCDHPGKKSYAERMKEFKP